MTTWKTVTVKSSGGDYTSANAAINTETTDLTLQTGDLVIELYNFDDATRIAQTTFEGYTTDATHRVIIRAIEKHDGTWSTSGARTKVGGNIGEMHLLDTECEYVVWEDVQWQVRSTAASGKLFWISIGGTTGRWQFDRCVFLFNHNDAPDVTTGLGRFSESDVLHVFNNCLFYGDGACTSSVGLRLDNTTSGVFVELNNCTVDGFTTAFTLDEGAFDALTLRNTRVTNCTNFKNGVGVLNSNSDYNLTDLAAPTNWGANSLDSTDSPTLDYVDDASTEESRDFHLNSSNDSGYEAGEDISAEGFSDDIDGTARVGAWDIGIHELSTSDVWFYDGSIWRQMTESWFYDGSIWRQASAGYIYDGTAWKQWL